MQYKWTRSPPEPRHNYKLKKKKKEKYVLFYSTIFPIQVNCTERYICETALRKMPTLVLSKSQSTFNNSVCGLDLKVILHTWVQFLCFSLVMLSGGARVG